MLTSRLNLPIPGGWTKDVSGSSSSQETQNRELAAGIVGERGRVLDASGKLVARVVEGESADLVGSIVSSTGDILTSSGNVVGKAKPLSDEDKKDREPEDQDKVDQLIEKAKTESEAGSKVGDAGSDAEETSSQASKGVKFAEEPETLGEKGNEKVDEPLKEQEPEPIDEQTSEKLASDTTKGDLTPPSENSDDKHPPDTSEKLDVTEPSENIAPSESSDKPTETGEETLNETAEKTAPSETTEQPEEEKPEEEELEQDKPVEGNLQEEKPEEEKPEEEKPEEDSPINTATDTATDAPTEAPADSLAEGDAEVEDKKLDFSILEDAKVNKAGNVVDHRGRVVGHVIEGIIKNLIGRKSDENGEIWNDSGKVIGKAEPVSPEDAKEPSPFEDFPDAVVESDGTITFNGQVIGKVVEGDAKKLKGKKVDEDGDILDRSGNVIGKAERWEEETPEPEAEEVIDRSILAGKRVNKLGNVVDTSGTIFGRLIEGEPKRLSGRMCDKEGNVRSESGDILGKAEVVPEGEREGLKEGPFAELPGCTVTKDGKVVTPGGDIVGRLVKGDPKVLFGRGVDEDGDILDKNGNSLGKAERWEEPEVEKAKNPLEGRKINREGNVVDADGNLIGKLTSGELSICSGKEIDSDGDVVDSKGNTIGHASLLADIPPEPETESPEEKAKRETEEKDKNLAKQMAACITQCLDRIKPICKMITQKIEKAERTPKEELDEETLVKEVKPLIEEGHNILQESNGIVRGLDPDGHIQANAKHKSATRDASPEEFHLADVLKELTGTVTECIENAKRKIEDMPHAKKELNPLWGLLTEPLFQILAAVGLLLNGVLELVGRLLNGLGLGGLVNNLLGGLGLTNVLKGLGIGGVVDALTGKTRNGKKTT